MCLVLTSMAQLLLLKDLANAVNIDFLRILRLAGAPWGTQGRLHHLHRLAGGFLKWRYPQVAYKGKSHQEMDDLPPYALLQREINWRRTCVICL